MPAVGVDRTWKLPEGTTLLSIVHLRGTSSHCSATEGCAGVLIRKRVIHGPGCRQYCPRCGRSCLAVSTFIFRNKEKYLPTANCYIGTDNRTIHGHQYLRQCESASFAQRRLEWKFATHGHVNVSHTDVMCDYDGSYGRYELERGM